MRPLKLSLVFMFVGISPVTIHAQAMSPRTVAVQITDSIMIPPASRRALITAITSALSDGFCEDADFGAQPVDLNADTTPEVQVEAVGPCYNSVSGGMSWVFIRDSATGAWRENFGFTGGLVALPSRSGGFVDVMVAMAGSETPVWRWNGSAYSLYCRVPALPSGRNSCPWTIPRNPTADGLPSFSAGTPSLPSPGRAAQEGQRDMARRLACTAPAGSLGRAAICPNLQRWFVLMARNVCSGRIGDFYGAHLDELNAQATDDNIESWADMETRFFQQEEGWTEFCGGVFSRDRRVKWMKSARDSH
ncbi:MAG TPA: hypothetical protein VFJ16_22895 [Longimicrobium sp.]|nr:hypothetical protein [Longimicrobium sp.]